MAEGITFRVEIPFPFDGVSKKGVSVLHRVTEGGARSTVTSSLGSMTISFTGPGSAHFAADDLHRHPEPGLTSESGLGHSRSGGPSSIWDAGRLAQSWKPHISPPADPLGNFLVG